jgi:hypothetical protein
MVPRSQKQEDIDIFYQIEECVFNNYDGVFANNEGDIKFDFVHHVCGVTTPIRIPVIDDNAENGIVCMSMLDKCLFSEKEYPGTFWRELLQLLTEDAFDTITLINPARMFVTFISFMCRFNETFPKTLPKISHSAYEMHRAARFASERADSNAHLIHKVYNTNILTRFEDSDGNDPDPTDPINLDDVDLRFLDDL